jgi:hypothetical protein
VIIEIKTPLITLNEYINAERRNRYIASNIKRDNTNRVHNIAKVKRFKVPAGLHDVNFIWKKPNNKIDHDNISFCKKFILDGLQKAGSIQSDGPKVINNFSDKFELCKDVNYIWCIVEFVNVEK